MYSFRLLLSPSSSLSIFCFQSSCRCFSTANSSSRRRLASSCLMIELIFIDKIYILNNCSLLLKLIYPQDIIRYFCRLSSKDYQRVTINGDFDFLFFRGGLLMCDSAGYLIVYSAMQREEFNPDIELKFQQLLQHMNDKNAVIEEFLRILREICDAEIFYSRSMDKFANNLSKLIVGKDPLKEVFIIFERAVSAKSEQALELANNIKDDMIPFIQGQAIDSREQMELRSRQKGAKDIRAVMTHKLRALRLSENNYRRAYQYLKKYGQAESRADIQQRTRLQKSFSGRESALMQSINSYNHGVEEYLMQYSGICQKLSDIQTKRKTCLRDAINKYMIFQISCIKNLEYNVPRYMKSLERMNQRLIIQDRISNSQPSPNLINLAKISVANYIAGLNDREKIDIPNSHKKILDIKKNTEPNVTQRLYHQLVADLYHLLDETTLTFDVRVLKEIVYFSRNVSTEIGLSRMKKDTGSDNSLQNDREQALRAENNAGIHSESEIEQRQPKTTRLYLLEAIMCHSIFEDQQFWSKYQQKLFDIIDRESRAITGNTKDLHISLNFLAADIQFLKLVVYHPLPAGILNKFNLTEWQEDPANKPEGNNSEKEMENYMDRNEHYLE